MAAEQPSVDPTRRGVEIEDLTIEFAARDYVVRPVDHLDLTLPTGTLNLLLGPSGCGKTTLLSCLGGILSPTSGYVRVAGIEVSSLRGRALETYRLHHVGFVFQAFNLVPSLDATENVMVPLRAAGVARRAARHRAHELLTQFGLGERLDHLPRALSGGQQQRVAIARALALDPRLVLADEPTAHLDYVQVEGVLRALRQLADDGRVVVVSTHDDRMLPLADGIIELQSRAVVDVDVAPEVVELPAGGVLFRQGDVSDFVYQIQEGDLIVEREQSDGSRTRINTLGPGQHVGEMGPLFSLPRSATVRTVRGARLVPHTAQSFRRTVGIERLHRVIAGLPEPGSTDG